MNNEIIFWIRQFVPDCAFTCPIIGVCIYIHRQNQTYLVVTKIETLQRLKSSKVQVIKTWKYRASASKCVIISYWVKQNEYFFLGLGIHSKHKRRLANTFCSNIISSSVFASWHLLIIEYLILVAAEVSSKVVKTPRGYLNDRVKSKKNKINAVLYFFRRKEIINKVSFYSWSSQHDKMKKLPIWHGYHSYIIQDTSLYA